MDTVEADGAEVSPVVGDVGDAQPARSSPAKAMQVGRCVPGSNHGLTLLTRLPPAGDFPKESRQAAGGRLGWEAEKLRMFL